LKLRCFLLCHEARVDDSLRVDLPGEKYTVLRAPDGTPALTIDVRPRTMWVGDTHCKYCGRYLLWVEGTTLSVRNKRPGYAEPSPVEPSIPEQSAKLTEAKTKTEE
jgi:hypothetical protein